MAVSGADRQRAYLQRQRDGLLALRREAEEARVRVEALSASVGELRERNAVLEAELQRARQEPQKKPRRSRDLGQFLWSTRPKRQ